MIEDTWPRISGMYVRDDGDVACVWLAHDKERDLVHLYDACVFQREVWAVIAAALNARGRFIPVAWTHREASDALLERGVRTLPEAVDDSPASAEVASRDVWERMRTHRFKVDRRLRDWAEEYETFSRVDQKVPKDTHPLMTATRIAVQALPYARRAVPRRSGATNYPKMAIV